MSRKVFNAGEILTASDVNNFLMDQSVMSFASAAARTTAIPSPVEGMLTWLEDVNRYEFYNGSAWEVLISPSTGNAIINGAFDIWQRGTSISNFGFFQLYTADRWLHTSTNTGRTISRQPTNDTTNLPDIQFCGRFQRDAGQTDTSFQQAAYSIETVNSIPFAGKAVTLSFYARRGANYSRPGNTLSVVISSGTGTDQQVGGYTGNVNILSNNALLTTTWQRFSYTATVPTNSTELGLTFRTDPSGTAGANDWFEITGVQLEAGTIATPFRRNAPSIQGELAACQRYYFQTNANSAFADLSEIYPAFSTSQYAGLVTVPVQMRVYPTSLTTGGNIGIGDSVNLFSGGTFLLLAGGTRDKISFRYTHGSSTLTQFRSYKVQDQGAGTAFFAFSAEL